MSIVKLCVLVLSITFFVVTVSAVNANEVLRARLASRRNHLKAKHNGGDLSPVVIKEKERVVQPLKLASKVFLQSNQAKAELRVTSQASTTKAVVKKSATNAEYYSPAAFPVPIIIPADQCVCNGEIVLYEHNRDEHQGDVLAFENFSGYDNLNDQNFEDKTSSIDVPPKCMAILFEHGGGSGFTGLFPPGLYNQDRLHQYFRNDAASSIQANCLVPRFYDEQFKKCSCEVVLFEHDIQHGRSAVFTPGLYPVGGLRERGFDRKLMSALAIKKGCKATLFANDDFTGNHVELSAGIYHPYDLQQVKFPEDSLSSLIVECAGCSTITKIDVISDTLPVAEDEVPVGIVTGVQCSTRKHDEKMQLKLETKYTESSTVTVTKKEGSNWSVKTGVSVSASSSSIFGGMTKTFTVENTEGGSISLSNSEGKTIAETMATSSGYTTSFETPGAALLMGLAVQFKVDRTNVPAIVHLMCEDGTVQKEETVVSLKTQHFSQVAFQAKHAKFPDMQSCENHESAITRIKQLEGQYLMKDKSVVINAFKSAIAPEGKIV